MMAVTQQRAANKVKRMVYYFRCETKVVISDVEESPGGGSLYQTVTSLRVDIGNVNDGQMFLCLNKRPHRKFKVANVQG